MYLKGMLPNIFVLPFLRGISKDKIPVPQSLQ